jgi:C-terminal processing protease CtpA/Prc
VSTGEGNLADLAEAHMLAYLTAAAAIGEVISEVAVWELEQAGMACECHCSACALGICLCARHGKEMVAKARQNASSRPSGEGIAVRKLPSGSRAALAGLQVEDVIVAVGQQPIADPLDLLRAMRDLPAGADVALTITRGDATREVAVSRA